MMTTLSNREKKLLFVATIFIILFVAVQVFILPMSQRYQEKRAEYDQLAAQKASIEMKLATEPSIRQGYATAQKNYEALQARYPVQMPNEGIDKVLTGLCVANGLQPLILSIEDPEEPVAAADPATTNTAEAGTDKVPPTVFRTARATMNISGDYASIKRLTKFINDTDYLRLKKVSLRPIAELAVLTSGPQNVALLFEINMLEKK